MVMPECTAFWGPAYLQAGRPLTTVGECVNTGDFGQPAGSYLAGGPPGIFVDGDQLYVFVDLGSCPASIGCIHGNRFEPPAQMRPCDAAPLLYGSGEYGRGKSGHDANAYMDFRYASSAEVVSSNGSFYMFWEGERGGGEWGLNLASSGAVDARWSKSSLNPALMDAPILNGMGHTDLLQLMESGICSRRPRIRRADATSWSGSHESADATRERTGVVTSHTDSRNNAITAACTTVHHMQIAPMRKSSA
jgi:hypothetical protein